MNHLFTDAVSTEKPWREMTLEEKRNYRAGENARVDAAVKKTIDPKIPTVLCRICAKPMRFATLEPSLWDDRYRVTFDCDCGASYQLDTTAELLARKRNSRPLRTMPGRQ